MIHNSFYSNGPVTQVTSILLLGLLWLSPWQAHADTHLLNSPDPGQEQTFGATSATTSGVSHYAGLPLWPIGDTVLERGPHDSLLVSHSGNQGGVDIWTGKVSGFQVGFRLHADYLEDGAALVFRALDWEGQPTQELGNLALFKSGPKIEVLPNFSGMDGTYELTLLYQGSVVFQQAELIGPAGKVEIGTNTRPAVQWLSQTAAVLEGFESDPGFQINGQNIKADKAILRAENPVVESDGIHSITVNSIGIPLFEITEVSFYLQGLNHRIVGPVQGTPWISEIDILDLGEGVPWSVLVDSFPVFSWSQAIKTSSSAVEPGAYLRFSSLASVEGLEEPVEWVALLENHGTPSSREPRSANNSKFQTQWHVAFDLAIQDHTIHVLNGDTVVGSQGGASAQPVYFEAFDFSVEMASGSANLRQVELASAGEASSEEAGIESRGGLSLRFPEPVQVHLGPTSLLADQIWASPTPTENPSVEILDLIGIRTQGTGISPIQLGRPEEQLKQNPTRVLACGTKVTKIACYPPVAISAQEVKYFFKVEQSQVGGGCLQIVDTPNTKLTKLNPALISGSSYSWSFCVQRGTSCQVSFQGQYSDPPGVLTNQADLYQGSPQGQVTLATVTTAHRLTLPAVDLDPCPASIQICDDDDSIFEDNFECGLGRWSEVLGGPP